MGDACVEGDLVPVFRLDPELKPSKTWRKTNNKPIRASGSSRPTEIRFPLAKGMIRAVTRAVHERQPQSLRHGSAVLISTYHPFEWARTTIANDHQLPAQPD